jgi:hypothetical protein
MTQPIESGQGGVWQVRQTTLGTIQPAADSGMKRLRKVGTNAFKAAKILGSEAYVDGQAFASPEQFIDSIGGEVGSVTCQGTIATSGFQFAQVIGVDVVTGTTPDFTHTMASGNANGPYQTFYQQAGQSVGPINMSFWDALIGKLVYNCGQDQKPAHFEITPVALKAGNWFTSAPTTTDANTGTGVDQGTATWNWNEGVGAQTIDGVAFNEINGDTLEIDRKIGVYRGDSAAPACHTRPIGAMMRTMSAIVTDNTIPKLKTALYGTASPTDGMAASVAPSFVALKSVLTRSGTRSLSIDTPRVSVKPDDWELGPRDDAGTMPVTFTGDCLKNGSTAALTVIAKTADAGSYV